MRYLLTGNQAVDLIPIWWFNRGAGREEGGGGGGACRGRGEHLWLGARFDNEMAVDKQHLNQRVRGVNAVLLAAAAVLPLGPSRSQRKPPTALVMACKDDQPPSQTLDAGSRMQRRPAMGLGFSSIVSPMLPVKHRACKPSAAFTFIIALPRGEGGGGWDGGLHDGQD